MVYQKTPRGALAAYAPPSAGPFRCDTCQYQVNLQCGKPEVIHEFQRLGRAAIPSKRVPVEAAGCCNFHEKPK